MLIGSATTQQVLNKNDEAWNSFFKLPPFVTRVNPPGYKEKNNKRILWTVLRRDQYRVGGDRIVLKGLGAIGWIELKYKGLIHLKGGAWQTRNPLRPRQEEVVCSHIIRGSRESGEERVD